MSRVLSIALGLALGLAGACFQPPQPAVQFSCEPDGASECPEGYTCEADGCCHLDGSSYEMHEGDCQLGLQPGTAGLTDSPEPSTGTPGTTEEPTGPPGTTEESTGDTAGSTGEGGTTAGSSGDSTQTSSTS